MARADAGTGDDEPREIRLVENPDGQWTARDLQAEVSAQGSTRSAALENLTQSSTRLSVTVVTSPPTVSFVTSVSTPRPPGRRTTTFRTCSSSGWLRAISRAKMCTKYSSTSGDSDTFERPATI
ncbi:hypothetical protein ACFQL4_05950 [Halosimplex aquaticum]